MSRWHAKDHPIWTLAKIALLILGALVLSWANASSFDEGEVVSALGSFVLGTAARRKS